MTYQSRHFNLHSAGPSTPAVCALGTTANRSCGYRPCVSACTRFVHAGGSSRGLADGADAEVTVATGDAAAPEAETVRPGVGADLTCVEGTKSSSSESLESESEVSVALSLSNDRVGRVVGAWN